MKAGKILLGSFLLVATLGVGYLFTQNFFRSGDKFQRRYSDSISFIRFKENPIIHSGMLKGQDGENINGPTLIKVPDWLPDKLGNYYLYFAHHKGDYIRLAYADRLEGPWKIYEPGTLRLEQCICDRVPDIKNQNHKHIASPEILLDEKNKKVWMYYHCPLDTGKALREQYTLRAVSSDGKNFISDSTVLGGAYFRVFQWKEKWYSVSQWGILYRSNSPQTTFEKGPDPFSGMKDIKVRHTAVLLKDDVLWVFYSCIDDSPERIYLSRITLAGDWNQWKASEPVVITEPQTSYEGADLPLTISKEGAAKKRLRELRDPYVYEENGKYYLLYSVAGESGIAIGELKIGSGY